MPNICGHCQEEFYFNTEYREHLLWEKMQRLLDETVQNQATANKAFPEGLLAIAAELRLINISALGYLQGLSPQDAVEYYMTQNDLLNKAIQKAIQGR